MRQMVYYAFRYGNLEMSNIMAIGIAATGLISIGFFIVAAITTDTNEIIDSAVKKHNDK